MNSCNEGWISVTSGLPEDNRSVALVVKGYTVPMIGHRADGRWSFDCVPRWSKGLVETTVTHWHFLPNILEEAREAEWNGSWWTALQRQALYPTMLVKGLMPDWFTEEIPPPRFHIDQTIRYKTLGGPYITGTVKAIRYNLSKDRRYRRCTYMVGHAQAHLSDVPDEKCYDITGV